MLLYKFLKKVYLFIPGKRYLFAVIRKIYSPSVKLAGYLKFKGLFTIPTKDFKLNLYNNNSTLASIFFWKGVNGYESHSLKLWNQLSKDAQVIFDVGANFGIYGLISKAVNGNARVWFFEPLKRNLESIRHNLYINKFNAELQFVALSDSNGTADFYDMASSENTIGSLDADFVKSHTHSTDLIQLSIPTKTLDTVIGEINLERLDLIKIDVEGAEYKVLKGFSGGLVKFKPDIMIEISDKALGEKIQALLCDLGVVYNYYLINEMNGLHKVVNLEGHKACNYLLSTKSFI